jgi:hypothetical protein
MSTLVILYSILLFFLLTPGILITLPRKSSKTIVALTHAIVFGIIYHLTHQFVESLEGMRPLTPTQIEEKKRRDDRRARREVSDKASGNGDRRRAAAWEQKLTDLGLI